MKPKVFTAIAALGCVAAAVSTAALSVALSPAASATGGSAPPTLGRGSLVTATALRYVPPEEIRDLLDRQGFDSSRVRFGVDTYRLVYRTVDERGAATTASGLLALPRAGAGRLRVVSYAHGTMAGASDAPSVSDEGRSPEPLEVASAGYATLAPDYVGLGVGPGFHPYLHAATEAAASLDLTRAGWQFAGQRGRALDPRLLVTGFSQGGHAAMAFAKEVQAGADPRFRLAAIAPISGPYALRQAEIPAIFAGQLDPTNSAYYLGYFLTSWNRIYHLYDQPADAFRAPYDQTVAPLYDGTHSDDEIFRALPASYRDLVQPAILDRLRHPTGVLAAALRANDGTCEWTPRVPVRIFAARTDQVVAFANAQLCRRSLGNARLTDLGELDHFASGKQGLARALRWFLQTAPPQAT